MHPSLSSFRARGLRASGLTVLLLATGLMFAGRPAVLAQTNDLSLGGSYPPETLATILPPREAWHPFPRHADRAAWDALPAAARDLVVRQGNTAAAQPAPALPATLYLAYARDGDRGRFEGPYFERRRRLHRLVLAECVEGRGRFHDAIADALWALCEESTWCVPAHVGAQKAGVGLPDIDEPIVDLFAAQTASSVAWTLYLVGDGLEKVSPRIPRRAAAEVDRRILTAYLGRDYGWMGFGARSPANRPNNWNPWINGNLLTAALLLEPDPDRRIRLVHRALRSLDCFLQPYPADGGCDEGPGYWSRAGGSVLDNLDLLHSATAGKLDGFRYPVVREIGRFIHRVHIAGDWYVDIGDCSARTGIDRDVVYQFGRRIGDADLEGLACHGATLEELLGDAGGIDLGRGLRALFDAEAMLARKDAPAPLVRDAWLGSDDLQMMVARDRAGTTNGLFVSAWGGHNAQSHNHNDVGNLIVFADGRPVFVDLGAPTYTAKTFSRQRYEIPAMQSAWHNLPTIHGFQQVAGRVRAARDVHYRADDASAELTMDIAPAWPAEAGVRTWRRTVQLERGRQVRWEESFELAAAEPGPELTLHTPCPVRPGAEGTLELPLPSAGPAGVRRAVLHYDGVRLKADVEEAPLEDARLAAAWGRTIHRIHLRPRQPAATGRWEFRVTLDGP